MTGLFVEPRNKVHRRTIEARTGVSCFEVQGGWGSQPGARAVGILPDGTRVEVKPHPFNGWNWICPRCGRGAYLLHKAEGWACRRCTGVDYASRHRHRTIPKWHRLTLLRRRIGQPVPFSAIEPRPLHQRRYWRDVREIREIERGLIDHASKIADDLDHRLADPIPKTPLQTRQKHQ